MTREERLVAASTVGIATVATGTMLPWARIGGRNRSGFDTADTFIALATGVIPDAVAWVGRWWYLPTLLAIVAWTTTFAFGRRPMRALGIAAALLALAMWWLFVWAGHHYDVINIRLSGPLVATFGLAVVAWCCGQPRASMLARRRPPRDPG